MFDIRYHWLTLAALFFALGLGMLVGSSLGERGLISQEQARLIQQLEAGLTRLREENRALREAGEQLEKDMAALRDTMDALARASIAGSLTGRTYLLIEGPGTQTPQEKTPQESRWQALLEAAGAAVVRHSSPLNAADALPAAQGWAAIPGDQEVALLYVNPPPNVPIPEGWRGAVVWDRDPGYALDGTVLPSDWLVLRAGTDTLGEWVLVEGLRQGWRGYVDASSPGEALQSRLTSFAEQGGGRR